MTISQKAIKKKKINWILYLSNIYGMILLATRPTSSDSIAEVHRMIQGRMTKKSKAWTIGRQYNQERRWQQKVWQE